MTDTTLPDPLAPADAEPKKRPASQYYWGDWWKDKGLHSCSLTARGLWHEMNCIMHDGEPYGHLTLNGRPMTVGQLANQCRISKGQCTALLSELDDAGVPSRTPEGVMFSRRMVRDEAIRNARAAGGKGGAEHGIKGAEHGAKGGRPTKTKGPSETPLDGRKEPPPSSSSSSSSSPSGLKDQPAPQAPARPDDELPQLSLVGTPSTPPDCPHLEVLALWAEVLPAMPQHDPTRWRGAKADHLRVRWKETAVAKSWLTREQGLAYFRKLFAYVGQSAFLTGRSKQVDPNKRPFVIELEWLVVLSNWDKVHEGKYHPEAA